MNERMNDEGSTEHSSVKMKNQVGSFGKQTEKSKMSKMNCHDCDSTIFGYRSVIYRHSEGVFEMSENQNG